MTARGMVLFGALGFAAVSLYACSSSSTQGGTPDGGIDATTADVTTAEDAGDAAEPEDAAPADDGAAKPTNLEGVPYPTDYLGWSVRAGATPGRRIPNLRFVGCRPNSKSLTQIQFADFYDPTGLRHDVVALLLVSRWDAYSWAVLRSFPDAGPPARVAIVAATLQGTSFTTPATTADFSELRDMYPGGTHVYDPGAMQLLPIVGANTPQIVIIDARTMEIVSSTVGAPTDPPGTIETARAEVAGRPKSY